MEYTDENRGYIQAQERARQVVEFKGLRYENITPTDVDGFFEWHNKVFVFYEYKLAGARMARGQMVAMERLVDGLDAANKTAVLFLCEHTVQNPRRNVDAASAIVKAVYYKGCWHKGNGGTVRERTDAFLKWAKGAEYGAIQ